MHIKLSGPDRKLIKKHDVKVSMAKIKVADKLTELRQAEAELVQAQQEYVDVVVQAAKEYGIDTDDLSQKWNFDGPTMTFFKEQVDA